MSNYKIAFNKSGAVQPYTDNTIFIGKDGTVTAHTENKIDVCVKPVTSADLTPIVNQIIPTTDLFTQEKFNVQIKTRDDAISTLSIAIGQISFTETDPVAMPVILQHMADDKVMYRAWSDYLSAKIDGLDQVVTIVDETSVLNVITLGTTWTAPRAGKVTVIYRAALGVAPLVTKNGNTIYGGVSLLGTGVPKDEPVVAGDKIDISGSLLGLGASLQVIFYSGA